MGRALTPHDLDRPILISHPHLMSLSLTSLHSSFHSLNYYLLCYFAYYLFICLLIYSQLPVWNISFTGSWISSCSQRSLTHLLSRVGILLDLQERGWACKGGFPFPASFLSPQCLPGSWPLGGRWDVTGIKTITGATLKRSFPIKHLELV